MRHNQWLWMLPVLLLVAALGAAHLTDDAIWFDEWITYYITGAGDMQNRTLDNTPCASIPVAQTPPFDMICLAAIDNSWPPAFFMLLWVWNKIASFGALLSDRTLALFIGLIAVSLTYRLGKRLFNHEAGIIAALLLGTSAFFVHYLHEVRGYTLYVLFPALNGWLYWRLLHSYHGARRGLRWGFVLSIAASMYTHYIAAAAVLGIGIYHVLYERPANLRNRDGKRWTGILRLWFNGCLFYTPWVGVLIISFLNETQIERNSDALTLLNNMVTGFSNNLWWITLPAIVLSLAQWGSRQVRFLWVWGLTILFMAILGNILADFLFHPRHIMGMMPAFALLVTVGLLWVTQHWHPLMWAIVGLWIGSGAIYSATPAFMDALPRHISTVPLSAMNTIVDTVNQCVGEDDLVIAGLDTPDDEWVHTEPLNNYYLREVKNLTLLGYLVTNERENTTRLLPENLVDEDFATRVAAFTADAPDVWVFTLPDLPLHDNLVLLDNLLQDEGYEACGAAIARPDLLGLTYSNAGTAQCERLVSCAGE